MTGTKYTLTRRFTASKKSEYIFISKEKLLTFDECYDKIFPKL